MIVEPRGKDKLECYGRTYLATHTINRDFRKTLACPINIFRRANELVFRKGSTLLGGMSYWVNHTEIYAFISFIKSGFIFFSFTIAYETNKFIRFRSMR